MAENKDPINYYKCFYRGSWCIISFRYSDCVVADNIVKRFIRHGVVWKRISEDVFFNHTLTRFATFRLGAIRFDVGSRDPISYSAFFYSRLVGCYDSSYNFAVNSIYPGVVLPTSEEKKNI